MSDELHVALAVYVATLPVAWLAAGYIDARLGDDVRQRSPAWMAWPLVLVLAPAIWMLERAGSALEAANARVREAGRRHRVEGARRATSGAQEPRR